MKREYNLSFGFTNDAERAHSFMDMWSIEHTLERIGYVWRFTVNADESESELLRNFLNEVIYANAI